MALEPSNRLDMSDLYTVEDGPLSDFKPDQTCIANEKLLKYISRVKYSREERFKKPIEWYPFANSYYPYIDSVDTQSQASYLMYLKRIGAVIMEEPKPHFKRIEDFYSARDIQLQYLRSDPVSFILLGKPGLGELDIGKLVADYWKCVYVDPESLIKEEIVSNSPIGYCIEFNLRCGISIDFSIILNLLQKKIKSECVKHRGMVLCGFPLVPNSLYEEDPIYSPTAIFTSKEILEEIFIRSLSEIENIHVEYEIYDNHLFEQIWDIENQMEFLLNQFKEPFVIIYLTCDNKEVLSKRSENRYGFHSQRFLNLRDQNDTKMLRTIFTRTANISPASEISEDFFDFLNSDNFYEEPLLRHPQDFPISIKPQVESFNYQHLPVIEKFVIVHDPENLIRVDGRLSPLRIFSAIKTKLRTLPLQKALIPEKIMTDNIEPVEDEPKNVFENRSPQDSFDLLCKKGIVHPYFKWNWSDWGTLCPVHMIDGIMRQGDSKFSVHFMDKIFFPADETACTKFTENPRKYLLPPYPKSSCRIFIMGPKGVGKSSVARVLGCLLKGTVLNYEKLYQEYWEMFVREEIDKVRSAAIEEGIRILDEMRKNEFEELERNRREKINNWIESALQLINKILMPSESLEDFSAFPQKLAKTSQSDAIELFPALSQTDLALFSDIELCKKILNRSEDILTYLPEELKIATDIEAAKEFDDFVQEYANDAVSKINEDELEMSYERINKDLLETIRTIELNNEANGGIKGGWIVEGMPPIKEIVDVIIPELMPGEIYLFIDDPPHEFIIDRFIKRSLKEFLDLNQFFYEIDKIEAARRGLYIKDEEYFIVQDLLGNILDDVTQDVEYANNEEIERYRNSISEFISQWAEFLQLLDQLKIRYIEINVTDKILVDLLQEVVRISDNLFKPSPIPVDKSNIDQEVSGEEIDELDELRQNKRFGDTSDYCPVAFHSTWVLWKGKSSFAANFQDGIYLMSSLNAYEKFRKNPRDFLTEARPPVLFPPPRICIVGPVGIGKTTLSNSLTKNLGLNYINYTEFLKDFIAPESPLSLKDLLSLGLAKSLRNYFQNGDRLENEILDNLFELGWFCDPAKHLGFVLDGFPLRPSDVDYMIEKMMIPDVIIQLSINFEDLRNRLVTKFTQETDKRAYERELRNGERVKLYEAKREIKYNELLEMKKKERYLGKISKIREEQLSGIEELDEEKDMDVFRTNSQITYDSVAEDTDINEINEILNQDIPLPIFEEPIDFDSELEAYETEIEEDFDRSLQFLEKTREICESENIPWLTIDAALPPQKVFAQTSIMIEKYKLRNQSHFERVYSLSMELAENLLDCGYYFLSKFGKSCPVQIYERNQPVQMFLPAEENRNLFPMIHRHYVYYIVGTKNKNKFRNDPLKYLVNIKVNFPLVPMKIAVIGPPKSGKSVLCQRFRKDLGMKIISRGRAVRYVLKYLQESNLGVEVETVLRNGCRLSYEIVMKCVEALAFDARCLTQGMIYDGFPICFTEVKELLCTALIPQLIIDLRIDRELSKKLLKNLPSKDFRPVFSQKLIDYRYDEWSNITELFGETIDREFQNRFELKVQVCKWGVWDKAYELFKEVTWNIKEYYSDCFSGNVLSLSHMLVSPMEFHERKGVFKQYCPCCWYFKNHIVSGGNPPNRRGLVQYLMYFYYVCPDHRTLFATNPKRFLPPRCLSVLPTILPIRTKLSTKPIECYEDGLCLVCFWDNQPYLVLNQGKSEYAVLYDSKFYLFDHLSCLNKFMMEPRHYCGRRIHFKGKEYKSVAYRELPIKGLLEQYEARNLVKAITNTGILRPIIPGLSIEVSAAINIALHLKKFNGKRTEKFQVLHEQQMNSYHTQREGLIRMLCAMKKMHNPYLYYQEPLVKDPEFYDVLWASRSASAFTSDKFSEIFTEDEYED